MDKCIKCGTAMSHPGPLCGPCSEDADVGALVEKAQKACIEYFSGGDSGPFKSRMKELRAELDKWR